MAFRWKTPELKPTFVDPQGVRSTMASQQMSGYTPNVQAIAMQGYQPNVQPNVRGMAPSQATQQNNAALAEQNYNQFMQDDAALQEKKQRLAVLEEQLKQIDGQIAELQQGGADEEKAIAAKLAEIGDTSLYQGILSREQNQAAQQKSSSTGINNLLFEADKLSWGLNSKSDEERTIARNEIRVNLEKAKYMADQTGTPLPPKYSELERKLEDSDNASIVYESERRRANDLWLKARNKTLENSDIQEMEDYIKEHPNSEIAGQYRQLIEQYQGKTKQSKATASKRKQDALALYNELKRLDPEAATKRIANLTPYERKLLEDFYPEMLK